MLLMKFWRTLRGHRRRISFYDSEVMREAVKTAGPVNMSWLTNEALQAIVENEPHTLRSEVAHHELESRAIRDRQAANGQTQFLAH